MSPETIPEVGALPDVLPLEPGETSDAPPRHYRNRELKRPLCGVEHADDTPYARKWDDVTCQKCVDDKPERGRKKKRASTDKPKKEAPRPEGPGLNDALPGLVSRAFNLAMYANKRAPAPPEPLAMFSFNVIAAMEHYNLLAYTAHPLAGVVLSGVILAGAIKDSPVIEDEAELRRLHGMTDVQA